MLETARLGGQVNGDLDPIGPFHPGPVPDAHLNHLSVGHDPALLVSLDNNEPDDTAMGGLPMYRTKCAEATEGGYKDFILVA